MKGNDAGTSGSEIRHNASTGFHHQMYVDRGGNAVVTQGFQHHWPNRQIGNIVVIHDVKCTTSAQLPGFAVSSPRRAKSADRIEGAIKYCFIRFSLRIIFFAGETTPGLYKASSSSTFFTCAAVAAYTASNFDDMQILRADTTHALTSYRDWRSAQEYGDQPDLRRSPPDALVVQA